MSEGCKHGHINCTQCADERRVQRLESELATARERIAELESLVASVKADRQRAVDDLFRELESRNAAEKAAAEWVLKHGVSALASLATRRLRGAAHNEAPTLWEAEESLRSVITALAPAPDAKPQPHIRRSTATPEAREFWTSAERNAAEVESWPAWKRAGINVADAKAQGAERRCGGSIGWLRGV